MLQRTAVALLATVCKYSRTPFIRTVVIRIVNYPDQLGPSSKSVENSTKLIRVDVTGYWIKYSTELQIRRGRKVWTHVHTVNSKSRTSNCQCSLFSKRNPIMLIFCIFGWLPVPINPDKLSSAVPGAEKF